MALHATMIRRTPGPATRLRASTGRRNIRRRPATAYPSLWPLSAAGRGPCRSPDGRRGRPDISVDLENPGTADAVSGPVPGVGRGAAAGPDEQGDVLTRYRAARRGAPAVEGNRNVLHSADQARRPDATVSKRGGDPGVVVVEPDRAAGLVVQDGML